MLCSIAWPMLSKAEAADITPDVSKANAQIYLQFDNYLGNSQNIHPKVLYFEEGWKGYEYWMAYTPYPLGSTQDENPCIAVSHDGYQWFTPYGLENPLAPCPDNGYNSDTHLVYDSEADMLEVWWRPYDDERGADAAFRRVTANGLDWSEPEVMLDFGESNKMRLSPTVWKEGDVYYLIYSDGSKLYLIYMDTSGNERIWSQPELIDIEWGNLRAWHQDAVFDDEGNIEMIVCAFEPGCNNNSADLYYVKLDEHFNQLEGPKLILHRSSDPSALDYRSIYRSSILRLKDGGYRIYYSSIDEKWRRYMTVTEGPDIDSLVGLTDIATGIEDCFYQDTDFPESYYDLHGRKINPSSLSNGIFIHKKGAETKKILKR